MTTNRSGSGSRRFSSGRRRRLYTAVAVMGLLAIAVGLFFFIGNGGCTWRVGASVLEAESISPSRLLLIVRSCNQNPEVSQLRETEVDVQVKVLVDIHPFLLGGEDCLDAVEVQLQEPLGDRDVIDKRSGQVVRVRSR